MSHRALLIVVLVVLGAAVLLLAALAIKHRRDVGFARVAPGDAETAPSDPMYSIVLLLKSPRVLTRDQLTAAAQKAFDHPFNTGDAYRARPMDRPGFFAVTTPTAALGIINADRPYLDDPGPTADKINIQKMRRALLDHKAWLSIDWVGALPPGGEEGAYRAIAPLAAELLAGDVLALYCTSNQRLHPVTPGDAAALRGARPLALFDQPIDDVVSAKAHDPELDAAAAEARRRWPEFVRAFDARQPGQVFSVKKAFVDGDQVEHMWIAVEHIDGDTIQGRLDNDPEFVRNIRNHDPVTLPASELEDWIYTDAPRHTVGGFQSAVLKRR